MSSVILRIVSMTALVFCIAFILYTVLPVGRKPHASLKYVVCTVLCGALSILAYMFNAGWLHVFCTLPCFVYLAAFLVIGILCSKYTEVSGMVRGLFAALYPLYLCSFLLFADFSDDGSTYVFFMTLLREDRGFETFLFLTVLCFIASIVVMVFLCIEAAKARKRMRSCPAPGLSFPGR